MKPLYLVQTLKIFKTWKRISYNIIINCSFVMSLVVNISVVYKKFAQLVHYLLILPLINKPTPDRPN